MELFRVNVKTSELFVLVLAAFKMILISDYFMELKQAARWVRMSMISWIMLITLTLGIILLQADIRY